MRTLGLAALGVSSIALLGGCTTMRGPPRYAYYQVPCTTPGAVVATPMTMQSATGAIDSAGPALSPERGSAVQAVAVDTVAVPADTTPGAGATCVVAVSDVGYGYGRSYYPGYGGGSYGRPYYGSFGIGIGLGHGFGGGHGYRGHSFSGGHGGGRHH